MKGFIRVSDKNGNAHLINVDYIEEIYSDGVLTKIYVSDKDPVITDSSLIFIKHRIEEALK